MAKIEFVKAFSCSKCGTTYTYEKDANMCENRGNVAAYFLENGKP